MIVMCGVLFPRRTYLVEQYASTGHLRRLDCWRTSHTLRSHEETVSGVQSLQLSHICIGNSRLFTVCNWAVVGVHIYEREKILYHARMMLCAASSVIHTDHLLLTPQCINHVSSIAILQHAQRLEHNHWL